MKKLITVLSTLSLFALVGCGHNVINYSDGLGFETTIRPDSGNFGIIFRYGKILSAVVRENTEIEVTGNAGTTGGNSNVTNPAAGRNSFFNSKHSRFTIKS